MANTQYDVLILGAGASGLYCGATAAARGKSVLILEQGEKAARKISVSGGGKCNCTNREIRVDDYVGENSAFCRSALSRFTAAQFIGWLEEKKVALEEREHGQIFCQRSAKDIINVLVAQCTDAGCHSALNQKVLSVQHDAASSLFTATTASGQYYAKSLVVATGGPAWPQVGGSGSGYEFARAFGHRVVTIRPALAGLVLPDNWSLAGLSGIAVPASLFIEREAPQGKAAKKAQGFPSDGCVANNLSLLFTHKGLSGPAALQASLYWGKGEVLRVDFLPAMPVHTLLDASGAGKHPVRTLLRRHLPDRLCDALVPASIREKKAAELARGQRDALAACVHRHTVVPKAVEGFSKAEVTAGGVSVEDVSSRSMESKRVSGLYFCGEVLDVTGRLGGYNLHWAFASGFAAGQHV